MPPLNATFERDLSIDDNGNLNESVWILSLRTGSDRHLCIWLGSLTGPSYQPDRVELRRRRDTVFDCGGAEPERFVTALLWGL